MKEKISACAPVKTHGCVGGNPVADSLIGGILTLRGPKGAASKAPVKGNPYSLWVITVKLTVVILSLLHYNECMPEFLSVNQLLEAVREQTTHLVVGDERIAQQFTERNVRYYVTLGVVRPPLRIRGKSMWTSDHVKDLVRVRRAQSAGQSLREIGPPPLRDFLPTWKAANVGAHRAEIFNSMSVPMPEMNGWAFQISHNIQLSGFTHQRPTQQEIQQVTTALSSLISFTEDNPIEQ